MVKAFSAAGESIEQWQPKFDRKKGLVEQCEAEKSTIKNFRNAQGHHFGSVHGVEPFAMNEPKCNMDWALISVPAGRMGDNKVNPTDIPLAWFLSLTSAQPLANSKFLRAAKLLNWDFKPLQPKQALCKCG